MLRKVPLDAESWTKGEEPSLQQEASGERAACSVPRGEVHRTSAQHLDGEADVQLQSKPDCWRSREVL